MLNFIKKYKTESIIFFGLFLFWFLISFFTKAMFSGFHLTDDAKIFDIYNEISANGFWDTLINRTIGYTELRLKPLYIIHKIVATALFGLNYNFWSLHILIFGVITNFNLYLFAQKVKFSRFQALIFSLFTLLGVQSMVWMHLGYDEMLGMFFLSFALIFMANSIYSNLQRKNFFNALCIIFIALTCYTKETFILIIPAVIFLHHWICKEKNDKDWISIIKNNLMTSVPLIAICLINLILIKLFYQTDYGYAGISGITVKDYLINLYSFIRMNNYAVLISTFLLFILISKDSYKNIKQNLIRHSYAFILFLLIIAPQVFVYTKTGFFSRYLLPAMIGYSFLCVYFLKLFSSKAIAQNKLIKMFIFITISIYLINITAVTVKTSYTYAQHGLNLYQVFDKIEEKNNNSLILIVANPSFVNYEQVVNIRKYLMELKGIDKSNIYLLPILYQRLNEHPEHIRKIINKSYDIYQGRVMSKIKNKEKIKYIIVFSKEVAKVHKLMDYNFFGDTKEYNLYQLKAFNLYVRQSR